MAACKDKDFGTDKATEKPLEREPFQTHDSRLSQMIEEYRRNQRAAIDATASPRSGEGEGDGSVAYGVMGQELLSLTINLQRQLEQQGRIIIGAFDARSWKIKLLRLLLSERPALEFKETEAMSDRQLLRLLW